MRKRELQILTLLASAGVSARDFKNFLELARHSPDTVAFLFEEARRRIGMIEASVPYEMPRLDSDVQIFDSVRRDVISLIRNARYPFSKSAEAISDELAAMDAISSSKILRYNSKDGFSNWLRKAYDEVGPSTLIRATSVALSRLSKKPRSDWPLTSS